MRYLRYFFLLLLSLTMLLSSAASMAGEGSEYLQLANEAFTSHRISDALENYELAAGSEIDQDDRLFATRRVALLQWRYFGNFDDARATLRKAISASEDPSRLLVALAELENEAGNHEVSREVALAALLHAESEREERNARLAWASAVIDQEREEGVDETLLAAASSVARRLVEIQYGDTDASELLHHAGLLAGDGADALVGWESWFRVPDGGEPYETLRPAYQALQEILSGWNGEDEQENLRLIEALAASRFYEEALLVSREHPVPEEVPERVSSILAFAEMAEEWKRSTEEYYRRTALGEGDPESWVRSLLSAMTVRWDELGLGRAEPEIPESGGMEALSKWMMAEGPELQDLFRERFDVVINIGQTAGYFDLHMGYVVLDEARQVEQYGEVADIRFNLLDRMVSNGFQSWAWNYGAQHGGWASPEIVTQVRPAYLRGPERYWLELTDEQERRDWDERLARLSESEVAMLRENPLRHPPGAEARLERLAVESLYDRLVASGLEGDDLRAAFLRELESVIQGYSIFAHEGRHVIDKRLGIEESEELEFRAKLSEVAFAELPRLALAGAILSPNIGDQTPHGQANLRVLSAIVDWMEDHASEIDSLDSGWPLAAQIDLLTPEQLRDAVRAADPLNRTVQDTGADGP
ncbi:MAG: hypothetical protein R3338_09150, partial [Thermoanaerobaculia bacterium]|nr:hypothetical protein [Thermoanaerobaculia bacterium]